MSVNVAPGGVRTFVPIAGVNFNVPLGVAGWIDTDASGTTGTNTSRIWVVQCQNEAFAVQAIGVRTNGSAIAAFTTIPLFTQLVTVSPTGHIDLYRNAGANANYTLTGYLA